MAVIGSGDLNSPPNVDIQPGQGYRYTISVPVELPDWASAAVSGLVAAVLGAIVAVSSVYTRPAGGGWTDVVIEFAT